MKKKQLQNRNKIGRPAHRSLKWGYVFFESSMGCLQCFMVRFDTPYAEFMLISQDPVTILIEEQTHQALAFRTAMRQKLTLFINEMTKFALILSHLNLNTQTQIVTIFYGKNIFFQKLNCRHIDQWTLQNCIYIYIWWFAKKQFLWIIVISV